MVKWPPHYAYTRRSQPLYPFPPTISKGPETCVEESGNHVIQLEYSPQTTYKNHCRSKAEWRIAHQSINCYFVLRDNNYLLLRDNFDMFDAVAPTPVWRYSRLYPGGSSHNPRSDVLRLVQDSQPLPISPTQVGGEQSKSGSPNRSKPLDRVSNWGRVNSWGRWVIYSSTHNPQPHLKLGCALCYKWLALSHFSIPLCVRQTFDSNNKHTHFPIVSHDGTRLWCHWKIHRHSIAKWAASKFQQVQSRTTHSFYSHIYPSKSPFTIRLASIGHIHMCYWGSCLLSKMTHFSLDVRIWYMTYSNKLAPFVQITEGSQPFFGK